MKAEDKKPANTWIIENYPDGVVTEMSDGKYYVDWDLLLELMTLYAGQIKFDSEQDKESYAREQVKTELTKFLDFLLNNGYCDSDVYSEPPSAIDRYMHPELNN